MRVADARPRTAMWSRRRSRLIKRLRLAYYGRFGTIPRPAQWVFIVGCYNSGTTLLHKLLAGHPAIGSMPTEGQYCTTQLPVPRALGLPRLWALEPELFRLRATSTPSIDVRTLKRQWGAFYDNPNLPILLEKTPVNAARMSWLEVHFRPARFVAIVRNGYAVAEGIRRKAGHSLELAATQWSRCNEIMLEDLALVEHKMLVRYEDLTAHPDALVAELLAFAGVDASGYSVTSQSWKVHREESEVRNMNDASYARLTREDRRVVERAAGPMLARCGYLAEGIDRMPRPATGR